VWKFFHTRGAQIANHERVAKSRVICNLGTTSVKIFPHEWCLGTTSLEKPLPTFQLHGSIITTSFHIAKLGVMSQLIVFDRYMGK
jgi:hypothetical protein